MLFNCLDILLKRIGIFNVRFLTYGQQAFEEQVGVDVSGHILQL